MVWQNIAAAEIAAGAPITEELLVRMKDRATSAIEGPAGGYWPQVSMFGTGSPTRFLRVFVPRGASTIYVECNAWYRGPSNGNPQARIYATDGTTTSYSQYIT